MANWLISSPLVLEVVPPPLRFGRAGIETIIDRVGTIHRALRLDAINVPEIREESSKSEQGSRKNPFEPRVEPRELGRELSALFAIPAIINHVVVHHSESVLRTWFADTHDHFGIRDFVLVGGEMAGEIYPGPGVTHANQILRGLYPGGDVAIGNIVIPGRRADGIDEAARVVRKLSHGASFFTSQILYHADEFFSLLDGIATSSQAPARTRILISMCPLRSEHSVKFLRFLGVHIGESLAQIFNADPERMLARSLDHVVAMWSAILRYAAERAPRVELGVNLAPIGKIPVETTIELGERLRACIRAK